MILVGKTTSAYLLDGEQNYGNRLKHYLRFKEHVIPELKNVGGLSVDQIRAKEGQLILDQLDRSDVVVLLDENGDQLTSVQFSEWIQKKMNSGIKGITFVIGGAYGFSKEVYDRSNVRVGLSKMTFSHQMVRLIFKEQLYRACTILKGEPYHHK